MSDVVETVGELEEAGAPIDESELDNGTNYHEINDPVGSDVPPTQPQQPEPTRAPREEGQAERSPDSYESFDAFLDGADIEELDDLDKLLASGKVPLPPSPDSPPPSTDPPAAPSSEGQPPAEPAAPAPPDLESGDPIEQQQKQKRERERIRITSDRDRELVEFARAEGIGIVEAAARFLERERTENAEAIDDLVEIADPPDGTASAEGKTDEPPYQSVAEAEAAMDEMESEADRLQLVDYDYEKALEKRAEVRALRKQLPAIARAEAARADQQRQQAVADYQATWEASENRARQAFPELADADSPIHVEMERLNAAAEQDDPDLYHSPTKFFDLAVQARINLGGAPTPTRSSMSAPAGKSAISHPRVPAARGVVASPSARATAPLPTTGARIDERIEAAETSEEIAELLEEFGVYS